MARRDEASGLDRVFALLEDAPAGLHEVAPPIASVPAGLPQALLELFAYCDGAQLFLDTLVLAPSRDVVAADGRWTFGVLDGDELSVDVRGRIWRADASIDAEVCEGSRLDRWLAGAVDAVAMLYDADGEFADEVFDADGEILPAIHEAQLRAQLRRDAAAPAPRWRLAHALLAQEDVAAARRQLEELVAQEPSFAWAWLDLARISERLGELPNALDEARVAAEAAAGHSQAGYFWAQVARVARRAADEPARLDAARRAAELAPELKAAQLAGARDSLAAGDAASAIGLLEILRAVWPTDLEVLDLARKLEN